MQTYTHTHIDTDSHTPRHKHTLNTLTHSTHKHTHMHMHTLTHTHTHVHTHTHAHLLQRRFAPPKASAQRPVPTGAVRVHTPSLPSEGATKGTAVDPLAAPLLDVAAAAAAAAAAVPNLHMYMCVCLYVLCVLCVLCVCVSCVVRVCVRMFYVLCAVLCAKSNIQRCCNIFNCTSVQQASVENVCSPIFAGLIVLHERNDAAGKNNSFAHTHTRPKPAH